MKKYIASTLCIFTLLGCSNIANLNRTTQHIYNTEIITVKDTPQITNSCTVYTPLPVTATPEMPIVKLRQAADKSDHEVVIVLTKYIRDLREYIAKEKKEEILHHQKYLESCQAEVK